jgi:hypothetical protein
MFAVSINLVMLVNEFSEGLRKVVGPLTESFGRGLSGQVQPLRER